MTIRKQISIIVAIAEDFGIGKENKLLWHISEDLKHFKKITFGHTVVMGKNTFSSLPIRPLPKRKNIVITDVPDEMIDGCEMAYSIKEAIEKMDQDEENFVMGGASIYKQFFDLADKLYITKVFTKPEADTFFPKIIDTIWQLKERSEIFNDSSNGLSFEFLNYSRK
jgi:dihydrofolate reductase